MKRAEIQRATAQALAEMLGRLTLEEKRELIRLEGVSKEVIREIAQGALEICGFEHRFSADEFSAVVWDRELETR